MGIYLAVVLPREEKQGLEDHIPIRTKGERKVKLSYLDKEEGSDGGNKWTWSRDPVSNPPRGQICRKLIGKMMKYLILYIMSNHTYRFNGLMKLQKKGGPIGLLITGTLAEIVMVVWDRSLIIILRSREIFLVLHKRYVDDCNLGYKRSKEATKEEVLAQIAEIKRMANSLMSMIQMEEDTRFNHEDG